jgi:hypothetical protein
MMRVYVESCNMGGANRRVMIRWLGVGDCELWMRCLMPANVRWMLSEMGGLG